MVALGGHDRAGGRRSADGGFGAEAPTPDEERALMARFGMEPA